MRVTPVPSPPQDSITQPKTQPNTKYQQVNHDLAPGYRTGRTCPRLVKDLRKNEEFRLAVLSMRLQVVTLSLPHKLTGKMFLHVGPHRQTCIVRRLTLLQRHVRVVQNAFYRRINTLCGTILEPAVGQKGNKETPGALQIAQASPPGRELNTST